MTTHEIKTQDVTGTVVLKYWPILLGAASVLLSLGGIYVKLDYIAKSLDKNEAQFAAINNVQNSQGQSLIELRAKIAQVENDGLRTAQDVNSTRARVELLIDKARWAPVGK